MTDVPGSGTPGSNVAGAVGGAVAVPIPPDQQKPIQRSDYVPPSGDMTSSIVQPPSERPPQPSDLEQQPQRVSNPVPSTINSTPKENPLPPQYDEKAYENALASYNSKQEQIKSLNEKLTSVSPHPVYGTVFTPKGAATNIIGYAYSDNTPANPNDERSIEANQLKSQINSIQQTLGNAPSLELFPNPGYAKAKSYQDLPAGAKQYHAYTINNQGLYQETGTGNEYQDALVKAADLGINIKLDKDTLVNSKGTDISSAQGVQSYIASLVNEISVFGKPVSHDNGGLVSFNYNPGTKTIEVKGTEELALSRENASRVGVAPGPSTPQSEAYGSSFSQASLGTNSLYRGPNDTISQATKDIAAKIASSDVSKGIAPKADTYGGLASFAGEGSSNPIITPGPAVNTVKQNKLELPPTPLGGLIQIQPKEELVSTIDVIPTFENVLTNKEKQSGTPSQVPFEKLTPGLQSIVSGGLGGNETSVGGIQEFLKTHDYSKLTGTLPTEETIPNPNTLTPGISIEEQQSKALGEGLESLSIQQQKEKIASNALGIGLLSLSHEQQIEKAQSEGLGAALMDISNQQITERNQLAQQQNINAKVENAINKLTFETDLITSAKNAGAKTIDVFGIETDLGSVFPAKGGIPSSFDIFNAKSTKEVPLESIPISKANELLPTILEKYKGKEIQFGYTPAPIASPGPGATLETNIDPLEALIGTPLSNLVRPAEAVTNFVINTGLGLEAEGVSLAERISKLNLSSTNPLNLTGPDLLTEKQKAYLNTNPVPGIDIISGAKGALEGKGTSGFETGLGPSYDIPYLAATGASLLIGSGITKIPALIKSGIGIEAFKAALTRSNPLPIKGELKQGEAGAETSIISTESKSLSTYKNLNMMRTPLPKDIFALDIAETMAISARQNTPTNLTLENTAKEISQLAKIQNDLLKIQEGKLSKPQAVQENPYYINKVPMSSLGATNKLSNNIAKVDVTDLLPHGIIAPEELASGVAPISNTSIITPTTPISPTSTLSGNLPGAGIPGENVAGSVGGVSSNGLPDIFQAPRYSRIEFERRMAQRSNPDLFESNFVPISNEIIPLSLRSTEIGQRLEALDLFKRGLKAKQNPTYYQRERVPKELMGKFSKIVSNQTVGTRPEIFGQNQEVKLKIEDIEYNPASNFHPIPRIGRSPFDINFGEIPLFSKQEFSSNLLSPEEQALAERYPLMTNTLPEESKLFTEPRTTPETGKAPIQTETFNISETIKGREEAKFFGTFELKANFEEIGYLPRKENPSYIKSIPSGQRLEALKLFEAGIKAKLNPDYYSRIGIPKELMGKFSKQISEQTTGNKLPEIFGEKAEEIINKSNLEAFYSPSQNIRQFFERLESNNGIGKNKTKINTDKLLGIENEPPSIGESKERLSTIEQAGIKRTQRESKLIKEPNLNEEIVLSNARTFFENEMKMFSETKISLGIGEGRLIPKGGGLASILKNFGKPSNPTPVKPEEPKITSSQGRLIQILKEQPQQKAPFKEYPLSLGEGLIKLPKKTKKITANLTGLSTVAIQELEQKQSQGLIFQPLQTHKQAQELLYKPIQKQGQPQAFKLLSLQEESPALAQLYKPIQTQEQTPKLKQLTKQIEENPFPNETPLKQFQRQSEIPTFPERVPQEPPKLPPGGIFDEHKRKPPKKKKEKADLANFLGNAPEFDIVGIFKRNEIVYGNATISRLTAQDTSNMNKKYSEKYQTGKEKTLFTNGGKTIKVKGSTAKPKSFQEKFKKKLKI